MALTTRDVYSLLAETLTEGGYVEGTAETPAVHPPDFYAQAERLRRALQARGVDVEGGELPTLRSDGQHVDLRTNDVP
jgi:hypothetical protein